MRLFRRILAQLHRFVFWALILSILWGWIYTFVGDTSRDKKVLVYVDSYALEPRALSLRLEEEGLPEGIRMIQVRGFGYDLFGTSLDGDIYIMKESLVRATLEETPDKLAPLTLPDGMTGFQAEGETWGILVFDAATQRAPAMSFVQYTPLPDPETENYYLCFDANSLHLATQPGALDNAAWEVALRFLGLESE